MQPLQARPGRPVAVGYVRVSTDEQAEHGYSVGEQDRLIREKAADQGWQLLDVISDPGYSGASPDRPGLQRLLAMLDEVDVVVVWAMDRLTRDLLLFAQIAKALNSAGVRMESLTSQIDLGTPEGEAMAGIAAVFGQLERKRIGERVKVAMGARVRQGKAHGRAPFGYRADKVDGLVIDEVQAAVVRRIFSEYVVEGRSQRSIAQRLNRDALRPQRTDEWEQGTLSKLLANPVYAGMVRINGDEHPGTHEPIVDLGTWRRADQLRRATARTPSGKGKTPRANHALAGGLLRCGRCGSTMGATTKPTRTPGQLYEVYGCAGRRRYGVEFCPQEPVKRGPIDSAVWAFFTEVALDIEATKTAITESHDTKLAELAVLRDHGEQEAQRAQNRLTRVRRDYQDGRLEADDWSEQRAELSAELEAAQAQVKRLDEQREAVTTEAEQLDAESLVLDELTALRALIVGEARDGSQAGAEAFRVALRRLFEGFELIPTGSGYGHGSTGSAWQGEAPTVDGYVLLPHLDPDALDLTADRFPALQRVTLGLGRSGLGRSDARGFPLSSDALSALFGPIPVGSYVRTWQVEPLTDPVPPPLADPIHTHTYDA
jgi:site-specific DNA recombinase